MKKSTLAILACALLCLTLNGRAESNFNQLKKHNKINHNWSELSQDQYIDNLVACELKFQEHKWSKNIWPEANKNVKPPFNEIVELDKVREQVIENLKLQSVLADRFNTIITNEILQHDLERMSANSKDAKGLKAVFALFDNNPDTIAQCVSRPYLVKQKAQNNYDFNSEIHAVTKNLAETELKTFLKSSHSDELQAQVTTVIFAIEQETKAKEKNLLGLEQQTIKLSVNEFSEKVKQLQNTSLQEKNFGFIKTEILEQNADSIKVKTLMWQKSSFEFWLQEQSASTYFPTMTKMSLKLPVITGDNQLLEVKAGVLGDSWESTYYQERSGRIQHTAIWTGSEMIIWGGYGGGYLNSGGRYDPASDSWTAVSRGANVPGGRSRHTAIWTGSEMIVWGGADSEDYLKTGGRYDPVNDSWLATSIGANVPNRRFEHTAIWTGDEMIIWGGYGNSDFLNTGGRYDPVNNTWTATSMAANVPSARNRHTAIWADGEMVIWGGSGGILCRLWLFKHRWSL